MRASFYGKVVERKFHPEDKQDMSEYIASLDGKLVVVEIDTVRNKRSSQQNRYYWLILGMIAEHTGHTSEELHEYFKLKFLPKQFEMINKSTGESEEVTIPKTTTKLSIQEFADYVTQIESFAAGLGLSIPDANG